MSKTAGMMALPEVHLKCSQFFQSLVVDHCPDGLRAIKWKKKQQPRTSEGILPGSKQWVLCKIKYVSVCGGPSPLTSAETRHELTTLDSTYRLFLISSDLLLLLIYP